MKITLFLLILSAFLNAQILDVKILYLEQKIQKPPVLSNIIEEPEDLGLKGAQVAVIDSNKSAKFLNQNFELIEKISYDENELIQAFEEFIKNKNAYVILNVEDSLLEKIRTSPLAKQSLLINASSQSTHLRSEICDKKTYFTQSQVMLCFTMV